MTLLFVLTFLVLIAAEFIKGLSANGTPPVLQRFGWQMDLAYAMWTNILRIRVVLCAALAAIFILSGFALAMVLWAIPLGAIWVGIYWFFNHFWVGRVKFLPITQKTFVTAADNTVDPGLQVIGVDHGGRQKAFPVNMLFYHHQITDAIAGQPLWVTYCGLCRSGRVYDATADGHALDFTLVGAITFNAVFRDNQTGTWWRQETGEAAKGPLAGHALKDIPFEQMSLENWLAKHPDSEILQYDPAFAGKYAFLAKLLNYEASLPGWHRQETPPLIVGVEVGGAARAYDLVELHKRRLVTDDLGGTPLLVLSDAAGTSAFVHDRTLDGAALDFELVDGTVRDTGTGSRWDLFGRCVEGPLAGRTLQQVQSYQQFLRAWISFHGHTSFYQF